MKNIRTLLFLFLVLCFSAIAAAQAGATLLVTTDIRCNWKIDGRPMGLLMVDASKAVPVLPGEHVIEAATTDGLTTIHTKVELAEGQNTVALQLKSQHEQQSKTQRPEAPKEPVCVDAALNPTWTDPATSLMWTRKDNGTNVDWHQAGAYCSNLKLGGYSDWHLPTIEELQGVYDPSVSCRKLFDNGVTYNLHVKGNLNLSGWYWSSSQGGEHGNPWNFTFDIGKPRDPFPLAFRYSMRALCVRRSGE